MGLKRKPGMPWRPAWIRIVRQLLLLAVIFLIGLGIGNGRIQHSLPWRTKSVSSGLPGNLNYASVNQIYHSLKDNYDGQLNQNQLLDGLKHGLANAANDPYTVYFTPSEAKNFNKELNNSFSGVGAELGEDASGNLQVIAPITGTPAAAAGLQAKDLVASINGTSTQGMSVDTAVSKIRGPAGSKVTLQIVRGTQSLNLTITRQNITVPSVNTKILDGNVGYMQISTFADDTSKLAQKAADQFAQAHVKGIVLDLRNDPGGLLDAAINVSSLWLPQGQTVLIEKHGKTIIQTHYALGGDEIHGIPTVVLINGGSASASEIVTGALHDNGDAYVIGQKSYGKGVVQQLINFGDGSQLKVTVASWYRPNGKSINHQGIAPDQTVKPVDNVDSQLQAAQSYLASH